MDLRDRLRRRGAELVAVGLAAAALGLLAALVTYASDDPSFNTATATAARNALGLPGAVAADLLLQGFGVAGALPGVLMLSWAWRLGAHRGLSAPVWRLVALLLAMLVTGGVMSGFPGADGSAIAWPATSGLGGAAGRLVARAASALGQDLLGPLGVGLVWACGTAIALSLSIWSMGLGRREWRAAAEVAQGGADTVSRGTQAAGQGARRLARAGAWLLRTVNGTVVPEPPRVVGQPPQARQRVEPALPPRPQTLIREPAKVALSAAQETERAPVKPVESFIHKLTTRAQPRISAPDMPEAQPRIEGSWRLPTLDLLTPAPPRASLGAPSEEQLQANAELLVTVLSDYGVQGQITGIHPGPVVTLYELEPAPGTRAARVIGLADDVARSLSVIAVRVAVVPGRSVLGIEVPNATRETVYLSEIIASPTWEKAKGKLVLTLGKDIGGAPVLADLATMPHLLVAGTTGSGKSVGINAMILSLLYKLSPQQCRLIMIDPKMLELSVYEGIPHLMAPVVTEPAKAVTALKWTVREMERRYRAMSQLGVRNIGGYNDRVTEALAKGEVVTRRVQTGFDSETGKPVYDEQKLALEAMPLIVVVIDEMADLMMVAGKDIETTVMRLAQMARAAGIHVIMATQRPSVDVITGTIKANFPTRISFRVVSKFDSRTILQEQGAEQLLGQGDMLWQKDGRTTRVHGPFVSDREVEDVVAFLREQGEPDYKDEITEAPDESEQTAMSGIAGGTDGEKNLFDQAVDVVTREGKASTSFVQRHLNIGYNKAAKLIEQMEREGIIGPANHVGKREVIARRSGQDD
jgi:S-DNA-T family DNA segregation ATPase FtsK/SpoIIIE